MKPAEKARYTFAFLFFVASVLSVSAQAVEDASLTGRWILKSMIYKDEPIALPNPDLNLQITFREDGSDRLYWDRGDPGEFCERTASYQIDGDFLAEEIVSLNPDNAVDCGKDPDMQLGRSTKTPFSLNADELHLFFHIGEDELIYVFLRSFVSR